MKSTILALLLFVLLLQQASPSISLTNQQDVDALNALASAWAPTSFSWSSGDPCESLWLGVTCDSTNTMVINLALPAQGILGVLPTQIGNLANLLLLDLSYNGNLTGSLPTQLFQLTNLEKLLLQNCGFIGSIPDDLGKLVNLTYLALNQNSFTGPIPTTIGQLSQLIWLDLSSNQLTGDLPLELSNLTRANHFHLQVNNLSGSISTGIFNPELPLVHLLLYNNSFEGSVPSDMGNLTNLDILRLDFNKFSSVPQSLSKLVTVTAVQLDHNSLTGDVPNLSSLVSMQVLDLGYNQFTSGPVPSWFSKLTNLSSLAMEDAGLQEAVPADLFSLQNLAIVMLGYNQLNGTLDLQQAGPSLTEVDLQNNSITALLGSISGTLNLQGNVICQTNSSQPDNACSSSALNTSSSVPSSSCGCSPGFSSNPTAVSGSCLCSYPVSGVLYFTALKVTLDSKVLPTLKSGFATNIHLLTSQDQVSILVTSGDTATMSIFPMNTVYWDLSQANLIISLLSSKAILFPTVGPYEYIPAGPYSPPEAKKKTQLSGGAKVGIGIGVAGFSAIILLLGGYAFLQKRRAEKAEEISKPFASWVTTQEDNGDAPKLKGARLFTLLELKKVTNNFSKSQEIGAGGYGKVYKGTLPSGEQVAIKRSQASSQQGAAEFKNEIELLSRVHHKNLVDLVGFCFEEQMLIYEYLPNGTLRDSLSGRTNVVMDWQRRLAVALGSARGLAYLHTEADPPIIHRDVKSSNILLDEKLVAKVADFGLSKLAPDDGGDGHVSTQVKGTLGYLDPEYYTTQRLSDKSDVYSFGVVILELLTSKQPIQEGKYIVREVRTALQRGGLPALQQSLLDPQIRDCPETELKALLNIALRCVEETTAARPSMKQVTQEIEAIVSDFEGGAEKPDSGFNHTKKEEAEVPFFEDSAFQYSGGYGVSATVEPK